MQDKLTSRVSFHVAFELLATAKRYCKNSKTTPADAVACLIFSFMAVEGLFNDIESIIRDPLFGDSSNHPLLSRFANVLKIFGGKASFISKLELFGLCIQDRPIEKGKKPLQDFLFLQDLRNFLVHARPEKVEICEESNPQRDEKLIDGLRSRGLVENYKGDPVQSLTRMLQTVEVAEWAIQTSTAMFKWFYEVLPEKSYVRGRWLEGLMANL